LHLIHEIPISNPWDCKVKTKPTLANSVKDKISWGKYQYTGTTAKEQDRIVAEEIILVIGGCRSGKSGFALDLANRMPGDNKVFVATSVPADAEMEKRVEKHRLERGTSWKTVEEPIMLHEAIRVYSPISSVILVDCLTLWVSNLMFHGHNPAQGSSAQIDSGQRAEARIEAAVQDLETALVAGQCPVILVANEVGAGIVPENTLARQFRDHAGFVNQRMAKIAHRVIMTIAGIDVQIKPKTWGR
jgi:adenosylcobinamide kinase/adenosylcobinamide-phosphate guanylyltransferase